jgi:hypothetical protein
MTETQFSLLCGVIIALTLALIIQFAFSFDCIIRLRRMYIDEHVEKNSMIHDESMIYDMLYFAKDFSINDSLALAQTSMEELSYWLMSDLNNQHYNIQQLENVINDVISRGDQYNPNTNLLKVAFSNYLMKRNSQNSIPLICLANMLYLRCENAIDNNSNEGDKNE